ncbi:MAG: tyrosine-type recombinase/integrase [Granulosicoccus sp.]
MLTALFPDDRVDWTSVDAEILCNFVRQQAQNRRGAGRKTPGIVVRSFVRFLAFSGELDPAISGAIPTIRQSTHAALPTRLCTDDVERILNAVRESGLPEAARDYAILLMLSQLGVRSCEIANLRLEDIDWAEGQLLIRPGKTHQERALPLSQEVGNAIADYFSMRVLEVLAPWCFSELVHRSLLSLRQEQLAA